MRLLDERRSSLAFWLGCATVAAGVLTHLPMFLMGRHTHYVLAGMPMGAAMIWGMAAIVGGVLLAGYGLLPRRSATAPFPLGPIVPPENAPLRLSHLVTAGLLSVALVIDIMKPASLGFVTPGMRAEYAVSASTVAWLPFAALMGTVLGSFVWGMLADRYGRRAALLLSSVMFIGTSICGAMPSFWWNVAMCFLMGAAAGGMLPVAYALLAEIMPTRHRGWSLVLVGGIGSIGGYLAASGFSALLQPTFGWRIMWLLNFPTGIILVLLSPLLPESVRFLVQMGRTAEASAMLARFDLALPAASALSPLAQQPPPEERIARRHPHLLGVTFALTLMALAWSAVNFGILLWLPSALVAEGRSVAVASSIIAHSALVAAPMIVLSAWAYHSWSTKLTLMLMSAIMVCGLVGLALRGAIPALSGSVELDTTLLIAGSSGVIAILLPYTAENFPLRIRGRATGWVAGCSKLGGMLTQASSVVGFAPALGAAALLICLPVLAALVLVGRFGLETRQRDLRELELGTQATKSSGLPT
jgi:MFS transporter, putative metabolite:H+ symporter